MEIKNLYKITDEFNALIPELKTGMPNVEALSIILENYKALQLELTELKKSRDKSAKVICEDCGSALARF